MGGRYSSGTTAPAAGLEDLRPAPRKAFAGRVDVFSVAEETAAVRLSFFSASAASEACFRSVRERDSMSVVYLEKGRSP